MFSVDFLRHFLQCCEMCGGILITVRVISNEIDSMLKEFSEAWKVVRHARRSLGGA
jgi:hypothetical protein